MIDMGKVDIKTVVDASKGLLNDLNSIDGIEIKDIGNINAKIVSISELTTALLNQDENLTVEKLYTLEKIHLAIHKKLSAHARRAKIKSINGAAEKMHSISTAVSDRASALEKAERTEVTPKKPRRIDCHDQNLRVLLTDGLTPEKLVFVRASYGEVDGTNGKMYANPLRPTVHFAMNHMVYGHMMGDWSSTDTVYLVPMKDCKLDTFFGGSAIDTFFVGHVEMPKSVEVIRKVDGESSEEFGKRVDAAIERLGYKVMPGGQHSWEDSFEATAQFSEFLFKLGKMSGQHEYTLFSKTDTLLRSYLGRFDDYKESGGYKYCELLADFAGEEASRQFSKLGYNGWYNNEIPEDLLKKLKEAEQQLILISSLWGKFDEKDSIPKNIGRVTAEELDAWQSKWISVFQSQIKEYRDYLKEGNSERIAELQGRNRELPELIRSQKIESIARSQSDELGRNEEAIRNMEVGKLLIERLYADDAWKEALEDWRAFWKAEIKGLHPVQSVDKKPNALVSYIKDPKSLPYNPIARI